MIFVPLPFLVAVLLLILLIVLLRSRDGAAANWPFIALVTVCAVQSFLLGLRWGYDLKELRFILPVVGSMAPPLAYASFRQLIDRDANSGFAKWWPLVAWPITAIILRLFAPMLLDAYLVALSIGYAVAILMLGRAGPDGLDEAKLDSAADAHRALLLAAATLCFSALFDLVVLADFYWRGGVNAAFIAANANLIGLLLIGGTVAVAARARGDITAEPEDMRPVSPTAMDQEIIGRVQSLLTEKKLFLDENLTLSRLSRRAGIPARHISEAVNRTTGRNVSQFINDFRIREACHLLEDPAQSVTTAMFASGFQTKSNFNREFRRVTGESPAVWREREDRALS